MMFKDGKVFGKINLLDAFILLVIIGLVGGTIYKFTSDKAAMNTENSTIRYVLFVNGVREHTYKFYEEDLLCFDKKISPNSPIGRIKSTRQEPHREVVDSSDGKISLCEVPGTIDVYVEVETTGLETDTAFFAGGTYEIKAGSEVYLTTKYSDVIATVESIESFRTADVD